MKNKGIFLILFSLAVTVGLFILSKENTSILTFKPLLTASQISALFATIFFSYAFILSSRFSFLEPVFGGLDKVYRLHQITGRLSFILIVSHFLFLIFNYIGSKTMLSLLLFPGNLYSYNFGIFGLWSMCVILIVILYLALEYQLFVRIQTLFIIPFVFGIIHMLLIPSDISRFFPLKLFLLIHVSFALISWTYRTFLYYIFGPRFEYVIESFQTYPNDILVLSLSPKNKKMQFIPGQFAYVRFDSTGVGKEFHPFSIASSPLEKNILLAVKAVGDFTTQMKTLNIGGNALLMGPYGNFSESFFRKNDAVCIAGGIGITPFLGMIKYYKEKKLSSVKKLHLFYSAKNENDAVFEQQLKTICQDEPKLSFSCIYSERDGRLNAQTIKKYAGDLKDKLFFLCGPKIMMEELAKQLKMLQIPAKNIIYEDFSFK